eukprot:TRINITY_DN3777_c0_g1_i2.p1 TRINITY_DN3777_c0_g1~~TRINITY_DN3777_c0_g1_i2.p1  ORF type:complete len:108 (-),score=17.11 TRINITY_DN3777_c0_g1_i2:11-334(-)
MDRIFAETAQQAEDQLVERLLGDLLGDTTASTLPLPLTGYPAEFEAPASAICVKPFRSTVEGSGLWGTRTHTVVLLRADGSARYVEESFDPEAGRWSRSDQALALAE